MTTPFPAIRKLLHQKFLGPASMPRRFGPRRREAAAVILLVAASVGAFIYPVVLLHRHYFSTWIVRKPLSVAMSFITVQVCVMLAELAASCALKWRTARRLARSRKVKPGIREQVAAHLSGEDRTPALETAYAGRGDDVERCLIEFLSTVDGFARDRLTRLVVHLGVAGRWKRIAVLGSVDERRDAAHNLGLLSAPAARPALRDMLADPAPLVRAAACRSLLLLGSPEDVEEVFDVASASPLLVRVMLAGALGAHAGLLCRTAVPRALASGSSARIVAVLEMTASWHVSLCLKSFAPLMIHPDPGVRAAAYRMLPYNGRAEEAELWVLAGLVAMEEQVRASAVWAAARMRLTCAIDPLEHCLTASGPALARQACQALAEIGSEGWEVLERNVQAGDRRVAERALEALGGAMLKPA